MRNYKITDKMLGEAKSKVYDAARYALYATVHSINYASYAAHAAHYTAGATTNKELERDWQIEHILKTLNGGRNENN